MITTLHLSKRYGTKHGQRNTGNPRQQVPRDPKACALWAIPTNKTKICFLYSTMRNIFYQRFPEIYTALHCLKCPFSSLSSFANLGEGGKAIKDKVKAELSPWQLPTLSLSRGINATQAGACRAFVVCNWQKKKYSWCFSSGALDILLCFGFQVYFHQ